MPGLDGLRGLLVLGILAYHLYYAPGMFITVDGFFALSGFLITGLLLRRVPAGGADLRDWWMRRARRLVPAVAVVVPVVVVVFATTPGIVVDGLATMTWWANWEQVTSGATYWADEVRPLRHTWTLSIEEQFYVLWPLVFVATVALARRIGRSPSVVVAAVGLVGGAASFAWSAHLAAGGADLNRIYLGTDTRAGSIMLGCAAAALVHDRPVRPAGRRWTALGIGAIGVLVTLALVLRITEVRTYSGGLALAGVASTVLVVSASRAGPVASALSVSPLQWLGVRSYGIYLWSWPTQVLVERTWPDAARPAVAAATLLASFVLGDLSLRFVEGPLRHGAGWAGRAVPRRVAWGGGLTAAAGVLVVVALLAPPPPPNRAIDIDESAAIALEATGDLDPTTTAPPATASTAPPTTAAPSTAAPSTAAPAPTATPAPPPPEPLPPMRVISAGDSQAFDAAHPPVPRHELPPSIDSVTLAGVLGCGILVRAPGWTMIDPDRGGRVDGSYCEETAEVAEVRALQAGADWMVVFSGGFERPFDYEAPDGRVLPARHPEIRAAVIEHLSARVERARAHGVRTALVEWSCPGEEVGNAEMNAATRWHNDLLREVAGSIPGTITVAPSEQVCIGGDPAGEPTPEKERAWGYEVHPEDRGWLWNVQIGPVLDAARRTT